MSDPLRSDGSRALDAASEADRDAKIEQLLLVGLDHYFAAQYDDAINVWTRALFLDRSHARARAYIERARSALAERQRESEELLQTGVAAFHRGDSREARRLLQAAIDGGAPPEEALAVLDRLNRLDSGPATRPSRASRGERAGARPRASAATSGSAFRVALFVLALLSIAGAGVFGAMSWKHLEWRSLLPLLQDAPAASVAAPVPREVKWALPRRAETSLARARALAAGGHLGDALTVLDTIRLTDAQKPDADRLRSEIQRQLLGLTPAMAPDAAVREKGDGRLP